MSRTASPSTSKPYGLSRVCTTWGMAKSTHYWRCKASVRTRLRPGPKGFHSDEELHVNICRVIEESPFTGEGYRKIWARLRFQGIRTSPRRTLRIMREHGLLAFQRPGSPHGPKAHDGTIKTATVDEIWGTDMTTTMTVLEGNASVFFAVDHCSLECLGIHAAKPGTRFEALEPIRQGVRHSFGAFGLKVAQGLTLRHDNGSQYVSDVFQDEIAFLGIKSSPSYVREPQGNGIAERFVRILKENLLWVRHFDTVEEMRLALLEFKEIYNREWIVGRHGYKTPAQVRKEQTAPVSEAA
ncbi:MAG: DDE-type integrase/transposase/recombinase [Proteobacteria bacterium]|nr:DDE-type integrase/transposase/recombinase [Pseudomonadota bacterium]